MIMKLAIGGFGKTKKKGKHKRSKTKNMKQKEIPLTQKSILPKERSPPPLAEQKSVVFKEQSSGILTPYINTAIKNMTSIKSK